MPFSRCLCVFNNVSCSYVLTVCVCVCLCMCMWVLVCSFVHACLFVCICVFVCMHVSVFASSLLVNASDLDDTFAGLE